MNKADTIHAGELIFRIGSHLEDIMLGKTTGLEVLLKDDLLYQYYGTKKGVYSLNIKLSKVLRIQGTSFLADIL